jgi:hypothetical protein
MSSEFGSDWLLCSGLSGELWGVGGRGGGLRLISRNSNLGSFSSMEICGDTSGVCLSGLGGLGDFGSGGVSSRVGGDFSCNGGDSSRDGGVSSRIVSLGGDRGGGMDVSASSAPELSLLGPGACSNPGEEGFDAGRLASILGCSIGTSSEGRSSPVGGTTAAGAEGGSTFGTEFSATPALVTSCPKDSLHAAGISAFFPSDPAVAGATRGGGSAGGLAGGPIRFGRGASGCKIRRVYSDRRCTGTPDMTIRKAT